MGPKMLRWIESIRSVQLESSLQLEGFAYGLLYKRIFMTTQKIEIFHVSEIPGVIIVMSSNHTAAKPSVFHQHIFCCCHHTVFVSSSWDIFLSQGVARSLKPLTGPCSVLPAKLPWHLDWQISRKIGWEWEANPFSSSSCVFSLAPFHSLFIVEHSAVMMWTRWGRWRVVEWRLPSSSVNNRSLCIWPPLQQSGVHGEASSQDGIPSLPDFFSGNLTQQNRNLD